MTPQQIRAAIAASPELLTLQASGNLQGIESLLLICSAIKDFK